MKLISHLNNPLTRWSIGRVSYTGADGLFRVADVHTANSVLRRPIVKFNKMPSDSGTISTYSAMISLDSLLHGVNPTQQLVLYSS